MDNIITEGRSLINIERDLIEEIKKVELWGDLDISLEEYEILKLTCRNTLDRPGMDIVRLFEKYPVSMTSFLVFLIRYKYNVNFWGLLSDELNTSTDHHHSEIGTCTRKAFDKYGFDYSDTIGEPHINIAPIMYEAGLPPESSLDDLFYILKYGSHSVFDPQLIIEDLLEMRSYQIRKPLLKFLKRFNGERAIDFLLEIHDAMLTADQNMSGDSHFIGIYNDWKVKASTKEYTNARKKQDFQARPYFCFENGKRGLCIVLPRTILDDEWIAEVEWTIEIDGGKRLSRTLNVFGENGYRYTEQMIIPIPPANQYVITLSDKEDIEEKEIKKWPLEGIAIDETWIFNSNGRMTSARYLQYPFITIISGKDSNIEETRSIVQTRNVYPNDCDDYDILTIEPAAKDALLKYTSAGKSITLIARPQIKVSFEGKRLFGLTKETEGNLYTEIPHVIVEVDEGTETKGLELRIGKKQIQLEDFFDGYRAEVPVKTITKGLFKDYGTYSVKLYQGANFLKQVEFSYVPSFKTNYTPNMEWDGSFTLEKRNFFIEKKEEWLLEFNNCYIRSDETKYYIECPAGIGCISGCLKSRDEDKPFECNFELPVNPFEVTIRTSEGELQDQLKNKIFKLDIEELLKDDYWLCLECFGAYKNYKYELRLKTVNGVDQTENINLSRNSSGNINLSVFYDTLRNCPLPCLIDLHCISEEERAAQIIVITDNVQMKSRPVYSRSNNLLAVSGDEGKDRLEISRFGKNNFTIVAENGKTATLKTGKKIFVYSLNEELPDGIYVSEGSSNEMAFDFEIENNTIPSNGKDTFYVSSIEKELELDSFSVWLDSLMKDIIKAGTLKDIAVSKSYNIINVLQSFNVTELSELDVERLLALAYFVNDKCNNLKKKQIYDCMHVISKYILTAELRLDFIRFIADMDCEQEIFNICLEEYGLLLCLGESKDAKKLAEKIEAKSAELSMILRMGADDSIRNALWRDKYRDIVGKSSLKQLLDVPSIDDAQQILDEQKKFIREQPSKVRIKLTSDISGEMEPIQGMIEEKKNKIVFNKSKKPDIGLYMDHIRYVDQYVNWYSLSHDKDGEMYPWKRKMMIDIVQSECKHIMKSIEMAKSTPKLKDAIIRYEEALEKRFEGDPEYNLLANSYPRFFYLQGMAAFLTMLPEEYRKYGIIMRSAEHFMVEAMKIAPRISRRDLIMAKTFIFLIRKEEKLCQ